MATKEQLEKALRNAHAAGDTASASRFAQAIKAGQYENNEGDKVSEGPAPGTKEYVDKVRKEFESAGIVNKLGQSVDDIGRIFADSLSFGYADKIAGAINGDVTKERQLTQDARIRAGGAGTATDLAGGVLGVSKVPSVVSAVSKAIPAGVRAGRGLIAGTVGGAAEGAAYGGLSAAGHDQDIVDGMKEGAAFGVLGQGLAKVGNNALTKAENFVGSLGQGAKRKVTGTGKFDDEIARLENAKNNAYKDAHTQDIMFGGSGSEEVYNKVVDAAKNFRGGYVPETNPAVHATVRQLENILTQPTKTSRMGKPVSLQTIEDARAMMRDNLTSPTNTPLEANFGHQMLNSLDDTVEGILAAPRGKVSAAGGIDVSDAADTLRQARDYTSRMRKMEQIDEAMGGAERRASRSSVTGDDATIRANLDSILNSKSKSRGFTKDELSAMDELVRGTTAMNVGAQLGRLMPGGSLSIYGAGLGGGLGAAIGGSTTTAAIGAMVPQAVGVLGKRMAANATKRKSDELMRLIAAGGNKANILKPDTALSPGQQEALGRYFMIYGQE